MFIVIDWIDWAGKGTQVALLEKKLKKLNKKVKVLDYPRYWEGSAYFVEKYLNWEYWKNVSAKQASLFYAMDRFDDSFNIKQDLENYDFIISNRYVSASMIHQAGKIKDKKEKEDFLNWLYDLEYNILGLEKPDLTIFLNVSPETSQKLVLQKEKREYIKDWKKMDIHEADKNHLINAHKSAMAVVEKFDDWIKIDCEQNWEMKSIEEINKEILDKIL